MGSHSHVRARQAAVARRQTAATRSACRPAVPTLCRAHRPNTGVTAADNGQPVWINAYDPARAVACRAIGAAYGAVYVDSMPSMVLSFEVNVDGRGDGFLSAAATADAQQALI